MAHSHVADELTEICVIVWLGKPDIPLGNISAILQGEGMFGLDFAIVIALPHIEVGQLAFLPDMASSVGLSMAPGCFIINSTNSNVRDSCSGR